MITVVVATGNAHKVAELSALFSLHGLGDIHLVPIASLVPSFAPAEDGSTFEDNAYIKAQAAYELTGLPCIADDSGLEVPALGGEPGVLSARYAGANATDADNRALLAHRLRQVITPPPISAQFRCVLCFRSGAVTFFADGTCNGTVTDIERGAHGFGYDAMFIPDGEVRTFAEMTADEKAIHSHRSRAVVELVRKFQDYYASDLADGQVDAQSTALDISTLCAMCIAAARSEYDLLVDLLSKNIHTSAQADTVYEALLQTYLFAGYPVALEALLALWKVVQHRLPGHTWPYEVFNEKVFRTRGRELFTRVYHGVSDRLIEGLAEASPDLAEWMVLEGYGKVLSRRGLSTVHRELCVVAVLAALGHDRQLTSHVRGSAMVGASMEEFMACATATREYAGEHAYQRVMNIMQIYLLHGKKTDASL